MPETAQLAGFVTAHAILRISKGKTLTIREVPPAVPVLSLVHVHQPQVGVRDQGRRLAGLAGLPVGQLLGRHLARLVVDQGQELADGVGVALFDGGENVGYVAHDVMFNHSSAGTKRERWAGLPVATTTAVFRLRAWAARITSQSRASCAVGWPAFRACAHNSAANRMATVDKGR